MDARPGAYRTSKGSAPPLATSRNLLHPRVSHTVYVVAGIFCVRFQSVPTSAKNTLMKSPPTSEIRWLAVSRGEFPSGVE